MDPNGSPFRRPPPRPTAFPPRRSGFGPVPAASLTADARRAPARRARRRAGTRALRLGAGACYLVVALVLLDAALIFVSHDRGASHDPGVIIGLGLTRWMAGAAPVAWLTLPVVVGFLLMGFLARRGRLWAFAIAAAVYALDGLIVVAAHDWAAVAIHTIVLVMMVRGLDAGRRV